jgi:glycosyltransferase involved in cell wall biosynthesis
LAQSRCYAGAGDPGDDLLLLSHSFESGRAPPPLTVAMPARNVARHVDEAVASILGQTFGDFELVIRDDGSSDETAEKLRDWAGRDRRIRLHCGEQLGPAGSSNWLVHQARAPLVARMDADDVARPDRLARQVALMREAPQVALVGSLCDTIDGQGRHVRGADLWRIVRRACFVPFPHTSVMFRRSAFEAAGGYRDICDFWEDLDLWLRMARQGGIAVLADSLVSYRQSDSSARQKPEQRDRVEAAIGTMYDCVEAYQRGEDYDEVLSAAAAGPAPRRLRPMTFVAMNSARLWAGQSPRVGRRLLRRARLRFDKESVGALGWAALGRASPSALRLTLKALSGLRNLAAARSVEWGGAYEWRPHDHILNRLDAGAAGEEEAPSFEDGPIEALERAA